MTAEGNLTDHTVSELFNIHDQIHEITRQYVEDVLRSRGELDERVRMLSVVLDSIGDGLTILDKEGNVLFVSETALKTAVIARETDWLEQLEKHYTVYNADGKTPFDRREALNEVLVTVKKPIDRVCLVTSDRLPPGGLWVRLKSTPVFSATGEITGAVNIFHNITDLKRAADRIYDLYNQAPCGYQSLDAGGTIIDMNQTALDWIGLTREDVVGKKLFAEFLADDCQSIYRNAFSNLRGTGQVTGIRLELMRPQMPPLTVLWSSKVVFSPDGTFESTRGTLFDISERTNLEAQRNVLASLITHDLKNHLVAESVFLDVVLDKRFSELSKEERDLSKTMKTANHQFLTMSNDLLQLYHLEKSGFLLNFVPTELSSLIGQATRLSEPAAQLKGVELVTNVEGQPPIVNANSLSLHHAIYNLIDNAIKFSPPGGKVSVTLKTEGEFAITEVADEGPGISSEQKATLFTAPWSLSWEGGARMSTGLGLYLSKQIVESHGGDLKVESSPGKGSIFQIKLPLVQVDRS